MKPAPITAFCGVNGSGKTMSAIWHAHRSGRRVLTNVPSAFEHFDTLQDLLEDPLGLDHTDVVFDEAGVIFSSRSPNRDEAFLGLVQQLRKVDARLFWTAPAYARADKVLREVTQMVVKCRPLFLHYPQGQVWPDPRYVLNLAFDVGDFSEIGTRVHQDAKRRGMTLIRAKRAGALFDTRARVSVSRGAHSAAPANPVTSPRAAASDDPVPIGKKPSGRATRGR